MKVLGTRVMKAFIKIRTNNVLIDANPSMETVESSVWSYLMRSLTRKRVRASVSAAHPFTIAIFGTHTSGKSTIGRRLAGVLGVDFHPELGDILRTEESKTSADAHTCRVDYKWDDLLFEKEKSRDEMTVASRVVETWHIGNLVWALQRKIELEGITSDMIDYRRTFLIKKTVESITAELHARNNRLLCVFLRSSVATMHRRRHSSAYTTSHLPITDESEELPRLHRALDGRADDLLTEDPFESLHLSVLRVENEEDGDAAIDAVIDRIVTAVLPLLCASLNGIV